MSGDPRFNQVFGACYVTINSTHFLQLGGDMNGSILKAAFMVELVSEFKGYRLGAKQYLKLTRLPRLNIRRKYHGCSTGMINNQLSVIVAGGFGVNATILKSVEYLSFSARYLNKKSTYNDSIQFNLNENAIRSQRNLQSVKKLVSSVKHTFTLNITTNTKIRAKKKNEWKKLPSMKIPRSHFPTIITSTDNILIAGGNCLPADIKECKKVEKLNTTSCEWQYDKEQLLSIRYNHNSGEIPLMFCIAHNPCFIKNQGFVIAQKKGCL